MIKRRTLPYVFGGLGLAICASLAVPGFGLLAADHLDPPGRTDPSVDSTPDRAADIADIFTWHTDTSVVIAMTFSGPQAKDLPANYDRDVIYAIDISNESPATTTEVPIRVRFGNGGGNKWGVKVTGLPGVDGALVGPVETNLSKNGVKVYAGLRDDPFFFDLQGFKETKSTGTLSFNNKRNFFAGQNDTVIVIEIPKDRLDKGVPLNLWGSTYRFNGGAA